MLTKCDGLVLIPLLLSMRLDNANFLTPLAYLNHIPYIFLNLDNPIYCWNLVRSRFLRNFCCCCLKKKKTNKKTTHTTKPDIKKIEIPVITIWKFMSTLTNVLSWSSRYYTVICHSKSTKIWQCQIGLLHLFLYQYLGSICAVSLLILLSD